MPSRLRHFFRQRRAAGDRLISDALLRLAEEKGRVRVDPPLLRSLRTGRSRFFRVLAALLLGEKLYVFSRPGGGTELVANRVFPAYTRERAAESVHPGAKERRGAATASLPAIAAVPAGKSVAGEGQSLEDESALFTGATLGGVCRDGVLALAPELWREAGDGEGGNPCAAPVQSACPKQARAGRQRMPVRPYLAAVADGRLDTIRRR